MSYESACDRSLGDNNSWGICLPPVGGNNSAHTSKIWLIQTNFFSPFSPRSCLWNGQVRYRYCRHVGDETRADHEVHHPRRHGGYHCHLRSGRRCPDCRCAGGAGEVHTVQVSIVYSRTAFPKHRLRERDCWKPAAWTPDWHRYDYDLKISKPHLPKVSQCVMRYLNQEIEEKIALLESFAMQCTQDVSSIANSVKDLIVCRWNCSSNGL